MLTPTTVETANTFRAENLPKAFEKKPIATAVDALLSNQIKMVIVEAGDTWASIGERLGMRDGGNFISVNFFGTKPENLIGAKIHFDHTSGRFTIENPSTKARTILQVPRSVGISANDSRYSLVA